MSRAEGKNKKYNNRKGRWIIYTSVPLLILFILSIYLLISYAEKLIYKSLSETVYIESEGLYSLRFKDLDINLLRRSLVVTEFELVPDTLSAKAAAQDLYNVKIKKLTLSNFHPKLLIRDRVLELDEIIVEKPVLDIIKGSSPMHSAKEKTEPAKFRMILHKYLKDIKIDVLQIEKGVFEIFAPYLKSANSSLESISVVLHDFHIRESMENDTSEMFYSRSADIILHSYAYHFEEIQHELKIDSMLISSENSLIELSSLSLYPLEPDSSDKEYRANLPGLQLTGVDIDRLIEFKELISDSLFIPEPVVIIKISGEEAVEKNDTSRSTPKLMLPSELKLVEINNVSLKRGSFIYSDSNAAGMDLLAFNEFNLVLDSILLDTSNNYARLKEVVLQRAEFDGNSISLKLSALMHKLEFDSLAVSSLHRQIAARKVHVSPIGDQKPAASGKIHSIHLSGIDFQDLLNRQILLCPALRIDQADILFETEKEITTSVLSGGLKYFSFDTLQLNESSIRLNVFEGDEIGLTFDSEVDIVLNAFALDTNTSSGEKAIDLNYGRLAFRTPSLHAKNKFHLSSELLDFDSREGYMALRSFNFVQGIQEPGLSFKFHELNLSGIDLQSFLEKGRASAYKLNLWQPVIVLPRAAEEQKQVNPGEMQAKIAKSMADYIESLNLAFIDINGLAIQRDQQDHSGEQIILDNVEMELKNFKLQTDVNGWQNPLFSEDITLTINDFEEYTADKSHKVFVEKLALSKSKKIIKISNLRIESLEPDKEGVGLYVSDIDLTDFNFDQFYFENTLIANELRVLEADIKINVSNPDTLRSAKTFTMPDFAETLSLGKIVISNADFAFSQGTDSVHFIFDLVFDQIYHHPGEKIRLFEDKLPFRNFEARSWNMNFRGSNDRFQLKLDTLSYSSSGRKLSARKLDYKNFVDDTGAFLNTDPDKSLISMSLPELDVYGLDFNDFYLGHKIEASKIDVDYLQIKTRIKDAQDKKEKNGSQPHQFTFLKSVRINLLDLDRLDLELYRFSGDTLRSFTLNEVEGRMEGFSMDSAQNLKEQIYNAKDISLFKDSYVRITADSMYNISAKNIALSTESRKLSFTDFTLSPRYPRYEFSRVLGYQTDRMDIEGQKVEISGINFKDLIENQSIKIDAVDLYHFDLDLFRDKRVEFPEWHESPMPQELLRKLTSPLNVQTVSFNNFTVRYAEMIKGAGGPGEVHFENMQGQLSNITNLPDLIIKDPVMKLRLKASLMGESTMNALLKLHLDSPRDTFSFYGSLDKVDLSEFNPLSEKLFGVAIRKGYGRVDSILIFGNDDYEIGHLLFPYQKFRIQMIDRMTGRTGGIGDGLMTFLANNILLKSNNPRAGRPLRHGMIFYRRDPRKSIFNYLWKGILSGVESTLGHNTREQRKEIRAYRDELKYGD